MSTELTKTMAQAEPISLRTEVDTLGPDESGEDELGDSPDQPPDTDNHQTTSANGNGTNGAGRPARIQSDGLLEKLRGLFGLQRETSLRDDFVDALDAEENDASSDQFSPEERALLRNILGLRERRVEDAMVPRADIIAVEQSTNLGELLNIFRAAGHSRIPVYKDVLDEPVGMVHVKDVTNSITQGAKLPKTALAKRKAPLPGDLDLKRIKLDKSLSTGRLIRPVLFVPPSMPALDLLAKMQATRIHMAIVIDEYGGTDGLVTIEDLMEEIVGEIEDEHDQDEADLIRTASDGALLVNARADLEELGKALMIDFSVYEEAEEVDTLGGFVFSLIGRIPVRGEIIPLADSFELEVLDADPRRIKRVKIHRGSATRTAAATAKLDDITDTPNPDLPTPVRSGWGLNKNGESDTDQPA